jgi:uncharacterized protein (TIGR00369 family)
MQDQGEPGINLPFGGPFAMAPIVASMANGGHSSFLGIGFHRETEDWVELALPWRADLVADPDSGVLASGPIISLMDNVTGIAVWKRRGVFLPQVTVDLRVDYMRPAAPGKTVIGRGECYRLTRSVGFVRGIAWDERPEDPVAHVAGSFMLIGDAP